MGLAEQQSVNKCKQTQQPSQILERFLTSALSLASAWVQGSVITDGVLRFGPGLGTPRGAELPTAGAWSPPCSSWCPGRPAAVVRGASLPAGRPPAALAGLPYSGA